MAGNGLIDTGAIVALLDRSDHWHQPCTDAFKQLRLPLFTSEAVLTELFHLVGDDLFVRARLPVDVARHSVDFRQCVERD